ncbi:MAG: hypothetical protein KU38_04530 [Sulfurovum sp. FS08-3]|nr:MAG: hypothetical protein KU38_04530 [Sulfurovum sp. FS08-3]
MQPTFNPWIGYFDLIDYVDLFVFLDVVQLNQASWQTRNKIKIKDKEHLFSLPIQKNVTKSKLLIKDAMLDYRKFDFRVKLSKTLEQNYKKSDYFVQVNDFIQDLVFYETDSLSKYNINIIKQIVLKFGLETKILILSEANIECTQTKGDLVLECCKYLQANVYISPIGAKEYLDENVIKFVQSNIDVYYQNYIHPIYKQIGATFVPYLGIFDLLYNNGFEKSLEIIRSGRSYVRS